MKLFEKGIMAALVAVAILTVSFAVVTTMTTTTTTTTTIGEWAAFGQEEVTIQRGDRADAEVIINQIIDKLQNIVDNDTEIPTIYMHEEGTLSIFFNNGTDSDYDDDWTIFGNHNYTEEKGYHIHNGTLFAPNGSALFPLLPESLPERGE